MSSIKKNKLPLAIFFIVFIVYVHNLSRSVYGGDVGDLISAAFVGGVAHPPGYPLFTFLGFLLTRINLISPAFMVGLISVFASSLAVVFYYRLSLKITNSKFISLISVLILAFNYLFWFYTEIAEVFALNNFFIILLIFLALLYYKNKTIKYFYLLFFFTGLSLTNHQTIILLFPSLLILTYSNFLKEKNKLKKLILSLFFLMLGLLPYLYVPIAAFRNPVINWDNVKDLNSFLHLILRKDYGTFSSGLFAPPNVQQRVVILNTYLFNLITQLTIPTILISITGAITTFVKNKKLFFAFFLGFFLSGPFFITYAGFPLVSGFALGVYERFIIFSSIMLLLFLPTGLKNVSNFIHSLVNKKININFIISIFLIIPFMLFYFNFPKTDLHTVFTGDYLIYDIFSPLPKNAVIVLTGDTIMFNARYVFYALKYRPDIVILDYEHVIDKNLLADLLIKESKNRSIFSIVPTQKSKGGKIIWMPYGLTYELLASAKEAPTKDNFLNIQTKIWNSFKYIKSKDYQSNKLALESLTISEIKKTYSDAMLNTGTYVYAHYNDKKGAYAIFNKAENIDDKNPNVYFTLGLYYLVEKDCQKAQENFDMAININPIDTESYKYLIYDYKYCFKNDSKANSIIKYYNSYFKTDIISKISSPEAVLK